MFEITVIRSIVGQNLDNIAPTVGFSKVEHKYKVGKNNFTKKTCFGRGIIMCKKHGMT